MMKSLAFFSKNATEPDPAVAATAIQNPVSAEITINKAFSAMSCCGINNETPRPGYAAQLSWMDDEWNLGQIELVAGDALLHQVVVRMDWQPKNAPIRSTESAPLPAWAWDAMFAAGTKILLQAKIESGAVLVNAQLNTFYLAVDSGWLTLPLFVQPIVIESILVGLGNAMSARFANLDADFKMHFATPNDIQYSFATRSGADFLPKLGPTPDPMTGNYPVLGEMDYWRISDEDSNADQDNLSPDSWTFTQKSP